MRVRNSRDLGALIRETRRQQRLTQENLAIMAGVQRSWLARLESGGENPTMTNLFAVLNALNLRLDLTPEMTERPAVRKVARTGTKSMSSSRRTGSTANRSMSTGVKISRGRPEVTMSPRAVRNVTNTKRAPKDQRTAKQRTVNAVKLTRKAPTTPAFTGSPKRSDTVTPSPEELLANVLEHTRNPHRKGFGTPAEHAVLPFRRRDDS